VKLLLLTLLYSVVYAQGTTSFESSAIKIKMHKENYIFPVYRTTPKQRDANNSNELKYQLSLKLELFKTESSSLNFAYTQKSYWQVYDDENSRPFRETNYNPELFYRLGSKLTFVDFGYEHESNGEEDPLSRSWDRIYIKMFLQSPRFRISYKVWTVVDEEYYGPQYIERDQSMKHYYGVQELEFGVQVGSIVLKAKGRYNTESEHGFFESMLLFPLNKTVLFGVVYASGYGDNLRSYNSKHDSVGVGFLLNP
jgi:phospholipase A1